VRVVAAHIPRQQGLANLGTMDTAVREIAAGLACLERRGQGRLGAALSSLPRSDGLQQGSDAYEIATGEIAIEYIIRYRLKYLPPPQGDA